MQHSRKLDRWPDDKLRVGNRKSHEAGQVSALQSEIDATTKEIREAFRDGEQARPTLKAKLTHNA